MEQIGEKHLKFDTYTNGIYYYAVDVWIGKEQRSVILPRYHTFLGWVEIFGLPPQHEWAVLSDIEPFKKTAELVVDDRQFREHCTYVPKKNESQHRVRLERTNQNDDTETCIWTEDYSGAQKDITNETVFTHKDGSYTCTTKKSLVTFDALSAAERAFAERVFGERGETDVIWRKEFHAKGALPQIYYTIFPAVPGADLTDALGSTLEFGYLQKDRAKPIEQVHGDWYKRIDISGTIFYITEDGFSSKRIETKNGTETIKNTYRKRLFKE